VILFAFSAIGGLRSSCDVAILRSTFSEARGVW
jgi:hypothetical protein